MPAYRQGQLDGLCGVYAIINAVQRLLGKSRVDGVTDDLFKAVARAIPRKDHPTLLYHGLRRKTVARIARAAARYLNKSLGTDVAVCQPFRHRTFRNIKAFLSELDTIHMTPSATFILRVDWAGRQGGHWTVLKQIKSDRLVLLDSIGQRQISRHALSLRSERKHRITPRDAIQFQLR